MEKNKKLEEMFLEAKEMISRDSKKKKPPPDEFVGIISRFERFDKGGHKVRIDGTMGVNPPKERTDGKNLDDN